MLLKEYRIPFPATLEEYRIGMLYMISRATDEENRRSTEKSTIQIVKREDFYDYQRGVHGIYTEKRIHIRNFLPFFIKVFVPEEKCILIEKAWNAFPDYCLTVYESPFLNTSFHVSIESRYVADDNGSQENALSLSEEELKQREIVNLNIASEEFLHMTPETNVVNFKSQSLVRPRLDAEGLWMNNSTPIMCCYRVARINMSAKGLPGSRIEQWGHRSAMTAAFLHYNRQVICWMDSWYGLDVSSVDGSSGATRSALTNKCSRHGLRPRIEAAATALATEIAAESSAGLAFSFSDETNPFVT